MIMPPEPYKPETKKQKILYYSLTIGIALAVCIAVGAVVTSTISEMKYFEPGNYTIADKRVEEETIFVFWKEQSGTVLFEEHPEWGYMWIWQSDFNRLEVGDIYSYVPTYW